MFEALGDGFTLIAFDAPRALVQEFRRAADALHIPMGIVEDSRADGRELYNASAILVRPDQFVAWASDRADHDPADILRRAVGGEP